MSADSETLALYEHCPPDEWDPMEYVGSLPQILRQSVEAFLYGLCFPMTEALHRRTGWDRYIIFDDFTGASTHALVRSPEGVWLDAAGYRTLDELLLYYECHSPVAVPADEELMCEYSKVLSEVSIGAAEKLLDQLPAHPWRRHLAPGYKSAA